MPRSGPVLSHWHALIDDFSTSALDFYRAAEDAVKSCEIPDATFSRVEFKEGSVVSAKREYLRIERGNTAFDICAAPFGKGYFFSWWLIRLGPAHPWLWVLAVLGAFLVWTLMLLSSLSQMVTGSLLGQQTGAGCFFIVLLFGFPAAIFGIGWSIREGYIFDEEQVLALPLIGWLYERLFSPQTYYRFDTALMFQESVRRAVNEVIDELLTDQGLRALTEEQKKPTLRDLAK